MMGSSLVEGCSGAPWGGGGRSLGDGISGRKLRSFEMGAKGVNGWVPLHEKKKC